MMGSIKTFGLIILSLKFEKSFLIMIDSGRAEEQMEENRCFICASKEHRGNACTRPGGGADPDKEKHWAEYRKRRDEEGGGTRQTQRKGQG